MYVCMCMYGPKRITITIVFPFFFCSVFFAVVGFIDQSERKTHKREEAKKQAYNKVLLNSLSSKKIKNKNKGNIQKAQTPAGIGVEAAGLIG